MFAALHLHSCPADLTREDILTRLSAVAADMTPRWERLTARTLVLDVSGLQRILGGPEEIAAAARTLARDRDLEVHVTVAFTWTAALVLASAGIEAVVAQRDAALALSPLPVEALAAIPGVDLALAGAVRVRRLGGARNYRLSAGLGLLGEAGEASPSESDTDDHGNEAPIRMPPSSPARRR